jgi:hypothetical protein
MIYYVIVGSLYADEVPDKFIIEDYVHDKLVFEDYFGPWQWQRKIVLVAKGIKL